ncbi:MAG TPA: YdbH domain-containing protein [Aliidongia sp.]|nr:YdbH domain-containing protein [Aliidongia sp.]
MRNLQRVAGSRRELFEAMEQIARGAWPDRAIPEHGLLDKMARRRLSSADPVAILSTIPNATLRGAKARGLPIASILSPVMQDGPTAPLTTESRRAWRMWRVLCATFVVCLIAALTASVLARRDLVEGLLRLGLVHAGIAPQTLEVRSIGLGGAAFGPLRLGGADGPSASAIEIGWTPWGLLHARLARLRVEGLQLNLAIDHGAVTVAGLPGGGGSGGGTAPAFEKVELADARITLAAPIGKATLSLEATAVQDAQGVMTGRAAIDVIGMPVSGTPVPLAIDLPEWRLVAMGQQPRLDLAHGSLVLPRQGVQLTGAAISVTAAGEAMALRLTGELHDRSAPAAWAPLVLALDGRRDMGALTLNGHAETADKALFLTIDGRHELASGRGSARIRLAPIEFKPEGQQPRDLFPLAGHALERVAGSVAGSGTVSWGGKDAAATLTLVLQGVGFEGDLARVSGVDGRVVFDALMPPHTPGPQQLTGALQIATLPQAPFELRLSLPGADRLLLEAATLKVVGGTLSLANVALERDRPLDATLEVRDVDLGTVLTLIGVDGLSGSGALDGRIPVRVDPAGVAIAGGQLTARAPGVVRYTGTGLPGAVRAPADSAADTLTLLRQALEDFHYTSLSLGLDRAPSGEGSLLIGLKGANPAVLDGYPFALNIRVEANFDRLAALFRDGYAAAGGLLRQTAR